MSSFFGLFNLSNQPVAPFRLANMLSKMHYWKADRVSTWHDQQIGLGQLTLYASPQSTYEQTPYSEGHFTIVSNAVLHNRETLLKLLSIKSPPEQTPDSRLILLAYQKWQENCVEYLLGEFSFAIWDKKDHSIFCAKDVLGIRPLYYTHSKDHFIFSSEIKGIFASDLKERELNELMLSVHIIGFQGEKTQTSYKDIYMLPAAHWLKVSPGKTIVNQYWHWERDKEIKLKDNKEYEEGFREHLKNAISRRVNSSYPVGCLLSGGLDSSSIAGITLKEHPQKPLSLYSWAPATEDYNDPGTEHYYLNAFFKMHKNARLWHAYPEIGQGYFRQIPEIVKHFDEPLRDLEFYTRFPSYQLAQKDGVRTLISGLGGDELASNAANEFVIGLLFNFNWVKMAQELYLMRHFKRASIRYLLNRHLYRPLSALIIGEAPWAAGNSKFGKGYFNQEKLYSYLNPEFVNQVRIKEFIRDHPSNSNFTNPFKDPLKQALYLNLASSSLSISLNQRYPVSLAYGIQYTYPLLDLDLVKYCLSLPSEQFQQRGINRSLIRRSLKGYVPEEILKRKSKHPTYPNLNERVCQDLSWLEKHEATLWKQNDYISKIINLTRLEKHLEMMKNGHKSSNSDLLRTLFMTFFLKEASND